MCQMKTDNQDRPCTATVPLHGYWVGIRGGGEGGRVDNQKSAAGLLLESFHRTIDLYPLPFRPKRRDFLAPGENSKAYMKTRAKIY